MYENVLCILQNFCHKLKYDLSAEELQKLMIKNHTSTGRLAVDCFMDNLNSYLLVK